MPVRVHTLRRLATLYAMLEEVRSIERDRAAFAVFNNEQAFGEQSGSALKALTGSRMALGSANREDALLHEAAREVADFNAQRLRVQRQEYVRIEESAAALHRLALMQQNQMDILVRMERARAASRQSRHEQAIADDRFSSRMHWLADRSERRLKNS